MNSIEETIEAIANGEIIIVTDDERRENEGDLVMAAEKVTPEAINFMCKYARGLICAPLSADTAARLGLHRMASTRDRHNTAFTLSVDAKDGVSTGISAADRAKTIAMLANPESTRADFDIPGHIFPLISRSGGVLSRSGHTEAATDLATLAGLQPAGVICEIMNDDGTMARTPDLEAFAKTHGLKWCTIADLIDYRRRRDEILKKTGVAKMPSRFEKDFDLHCYVSLLDGKEHIGLVYGDVEDQEDVLVRIHSECLTGDVFRSARCDCGDQLEESFKRIAAEGAGVLVYLRQEGRGIGLINKIRAYGLQDRGMDTVDANVELGFPADLREYSTAGRILQDLKVKSVRLLTNNPAKLAGLRDFGIKVTKREPLVVEPGADNAFYLETKKQRLGHML